MKELISHYLSTALWTATDDKGDDLDDEFYVVDFSIASTEQAKKVCKEFIRANLDDIIDAELSMSDVGKNIWLTRNGHGAGFFDLKLGERGDRLTAAARSLGEAIVLADDGQLTIE